MPSGTYYFETKAIVTYDEPVSFKALPMARQVAKNLLDVGYDFDPTGFFSKNEIQLHTEDHILSICVDDSRPNEIAIATETLERTVSEDLLAEERFRICVAASRFVLNTLPSEQVTWYHLDNCYITQSGELKEHRALTPADPSQRPAQGNIQPFVRLGKSFINRMFEKSNALEAMSRNLRLD